MDFNYNFKKDSTRMIDSKSYDYMNTEEQNYEDRSYQEKAVLIALIICVAFNVAVSALIFVIQLKCEELIDDKCESNIDNIGFKSLK